MIRLQVVLVFAAFVILNNLQERAFRKRKLEVEGRLAIERRRFKMGKMCLVLAWLSALLQAAGLNIRVAPLFHQGETLALLLFYAGFAVIVLAYFYLGEANKIGLPQERTTLKTSGIYSFGRNPLYSGLFLILVASVLYTANPLTLVCAMMAIATYHKVILAEEAFLLQRFGQEFLDYRRRVKRYFIF